MISQVAQLGLIDFARRFEDWPYLIPSFSLDGVDCHIDHVSRKRRVDEQCSFFSFKHKHDGLRYWVALHMTQPLIVDFGGGSPAGSFHDIEIARADIVPKMRPKMRPDERALADGGYLDSFAHFFTPLDERLRIARMQHLGSQVNVDRFNEAHKECRGRQEHINAELKEWKVLSGQFRHDPESHYIAFAAVAQLTQLRLFLQPSIISPPRLIPVVENKELVILVTK